MLQRTAQLLLWWVIAVCPAIADATNWSTATHDLYPGDFDGDGRDDLLVVARDAAGFSGIFTSASGAPSTQLQSWNSTFLGINWHSGNYTAIVGDFNGDNHDDVLLQRTSAGNSYILLSNAEGKLYAIHSVLQAWDTTRYRIVSGDFNGDGREDVVLQARQSSSDSYVMLASSAGQFSAATQTLENDHLGFRWSVQNARIHVGDFNNDGRDDLLLQAKPGIVMIDYDVPIPIPVYKPASFGIMLATSAGQFTSIYQFWSRKDLGVDWSTAVADLVIGDFNGDGRDDVMLVGRNAGQSSHIVLATTTGQISTSPVQTLNPGSAGTNWSAAEYRMFAADFNGDGRSELYRQASTAGGTNSIASFTSSGTVSAVTTHNAPAVTNGLSAAIGRIEGEFGTTVSGTAGYHIPIAVPTGTNGLKPALGLAYASLGGNGPLGEGWGVSGLSEILRCNSTLDQDGVTRGVELTANDRFCLDGNKLRTTSGAYGAHAATYQTEIDMFSRVTSYTSGGAGYVPSTGPQYFRVEGKDGLYYFYGSSADSRVEVKGTTVPRVWALNRVEDRNGNYLTIAYIKGTDGSGVFNGSYRPDTIEWARTAAGAGPYFRVRFAYESRLDTSMAYFAGGSITEDKRIDAVNVEAYAASAWSLVRKYDVTYESTLPSTKRSRVASIAQCSQTECLQATTFQYQNGTVAWSATETTASTAATAVLELSRQLDIDGDGRTDLVYPDSNTWWLLRPNTTGGYNTPQNTTFGTGSGADPPYQYALTIDHDSDGRRELLYKDPAVANLSIAQWNAATSSVVRLATNISDQLTGKEWVADFDGDGREDFMYAREVSGVGSFYVRRNLGWNAVGSYAEFAAAQTFYSTTINTTVISPFTSSLDANSNQLMDFNGDGKADFIFRTTSGSCSGLTCTTSATWRVLLSAGTSFVLNTSWSCLPTPGSTECGRPPLIGDFNGDNLTDVITTSAFNGITALRYGSGAGVSSPVSITFPFFGSTPRLTVDFDGDDLDDVLYPPSETSGVWSVMRSTGTAFETAVATTIPSSTTINTTLRAVDADGDGQFDIGYKNSSWRLRKHNGPMPDMMTRVTDGFGNYADVTYAPLTDATVYTKGSGSTFPIAELKVPLHVAKSFTTSTGIASPATYSVTFKYEALRAHLQGRGTLGFAKRTSTDGRTGNEIRVEETFSQTFPFTGMPLAVTTFQPNSSTKISELTNTLAQTVLDNTAGNLRTFPFVQTSVEDRREVTTGYSGALVASTSTTSSYDSYGNMTGQTVTVTDRQSDSELLNSVYQVQTTFTFDFATYPQMVTDWCLAASTRAEVRSTTPGLPQSSARVKTFAFDYAKCRPTQEMLEPNNVNSNTKVTTDLLYYTSGPSIGQLQTQTVTGTATTPATTPAPRVATFEYDPAGPYVVKTTNPEGLITQSQWNVALGVETQQTDANQQVMSYVYDSFGRLTRETRPDSTQVEYTRYPCSTGCGYTTGRYQIVAVESGAGVISDQRATIFDQFDRDLQSTRWLLGGAQSHVLTEYDQMARVKRRSAPLYTGGTTFWTDYSYDLLGRTTNEQRPISETVAGTQSTTWSYLGLRTRQTDAEGKIVTKWSNAIGQVVRMIDAANGTTRYAYDQFGNLTDTTDPGNNHITAGYNIRGFKTSSNDPDMGAWQYVYDSLGQVVSQTDAKTQTVSLGYDRLGRLKSRSENEGPTTFTYDTATNGKGMMHSISGPNGYSESYAYDSLGRSASRSSTIDATTYLVSLSYNAQGKVDTITYPESYPTGYRFAVRYIYENGIVKRVEDAASVNVVYSATVDINPSGAVSSELLGNGIGVSSWYDAVTGALRERYSGPNYSGSIQSLNYEWDRAGNLTQRRYVGQNLTEVFHYDNLHRLDDSTLNGVTNLDVSYNALGNISSLTGSGTYTYHATKKHAVASTTTGLSFTYDNNGNMTTRNGSAITWYSYNLPKKINQGADSSEFFYAPDRSRYKQIAISGATTETTVYVGSMLERVSKLGGGAVEYKHYVPGVSGTSAVHTRRSNGVHDTRYLLKDHLGSIDSILSESGTVLARFSYDAFGKRRSGSLWSGSPTPADWLQINSVTHRGFTGHEMLDTVGLIHMNGRVYDPQIGRFASADPFVQVPLDSQSLNRYSYVGNNPLNTTDPSGYFSLKKFLKAQLKLFLAPSLKHLFQAVRTSPGQQQIDDYIMSHKWAYRLGFSVATAATFWGYGFGGAVWASYYSYQATGSMTAAVTTLVVVAAMNYAIGQVTGAGGNGGGGSGAWGPNNGIAGPMSLTISHSAEALEAELAPTVLDQILGWFGVATTSAELQARAKINRATLDRAMTWSRANDTVQFNNFRYFDFWAVQIKKDVYRYCDGEDPTCGIAGALPVGGTTDWKAGHVRIFRLAVTPGVVSGGLETGDRNGIAPHDQNVAELTAFERTIWVLAHENWHYFQQHKYVDQPNINVEYYANAAGKRAVSRLRSQQ